jgi:HlyD family secretion protein
VAATEATQRRATAQVARAQAVRDQAQTDIQRTHQLADRGLVSRSQLEQADLTSTTASRELEAARQAEHAAQHDVAVAQAALWQLRGTVAGVQETQKLWQISSPVQGHVLRVLQENEGVVAAGTPLLEIANAADLEVVVDVLSTDAVQMHPGTPVRIERWGLDQTLAGRVRLIEPGAFTKVSALGVEEQRVNVIIDLVSPFTEWQTLGDNYRIDARILVYSHDNALKVPTSALFREYQQWMVFVVNDDRAHRPAVQVGRRNAVEAVVDTGVTEGDQVIEYPSDAVHDGVRVRRR